MKNYCPKCQYFFGTMKSGKCPDCDVPLENAPQDPSAPLPLPLDVIPLLQYIADPKKYTEELDSATTERDMKSWAQIRARQLLAAHDL